jgi:hypothetical protein
MKLIPLVSIVIPTCGRPRYLPRAVESALAYQGESAEVIVVPNGPDESWKQSLAPWVNDQRLRVSPITTAHGNVARNHGMMLARGAYLRFLDDDDYLLPAAYEQLSLLEQSGADLCSGMILNIDEDGTQLGLISFPTTRDFVCAAVSLSGFTLPTGNLFRRTSIAAFRWDESVHRLQDGAWMIDLAAGREWSWIHCTEPVGTWFQHRAPRTSKAGRLTERQESITNRLIGLVKKLEDQGRLTAGRRAAIAEWLWQCIHWGFPSHPFYWSRISKFAKTVDPMIRPPDPFYQTGIFRYLDPIAGEWALLPVRTITRIIRDAPILWRGPNYRRGT